MSQKKLFTLARQNELINMNRVLAFLVVIFTFSTGYLLALQQGWFVASTSDAPPAIGEISLAKDAVAITETPQSTVIKLLKESRYNREIQTPALSKENVHLLIFAAQGKITSWGERTVPSYKSAFPLTLTVLVRKVDGISPGLYWFNPSTQSLEPSLLPMPTFTSETLSELKDAPLLIGVSVDSSLKTDTLAWQEAGGVSQNILLAANEATLATFLIPGSTIPQEESAQLVKPNHSLLWIMPLSLKKNVTTNSFRK